MLVLVLTISYMLRLFKMTEAITAAFLLAATADPGDEGATGHGVTSCRRHTVGRVTGFVTGSVTTSPIVTNIHVGATLSGELWTAPLLK